MKNVKKRMNLKALEAKALSLLLGICGLAAACSDDDTSTPSEQNPSRCDSGLFSLKTQRCVDAPTFPEPVGADMAMGDMTSDRPCTSLAQCAVASESCLSGPGGGVCGVPRSCGDVLGGSEDAFCEQTKPGTVCRATDDDPALFSCSPPLPTLEVRYIRILDTSPTCEDKKVNGKGEAGADISVVELLSEGKVVGYAKYPGAGYRPGSLDPQFGDANTVFDGSAKQKGPKGCPQAIDQLYFRADTTVSLGCGGSVVLEFSDQGRNGLTLLAGMDVSVVEVGPHCDSGAPDDAYGFDRYSVQVCRTEIGAPPRLIDFDASCVTLGPKTKGGRSVTTLVLPQ